MISLTRLRPEDLQFKAEITAFLSLIFVLMLSLISALLSSSLIYAKKSSVRADMELALESVFAEYDRKLLEEYDIFARAESNESSVIRRLNYYGNTGVELSLVSIEYLSDNKGVPYYQAAVRYVKDWLGMNADIPEIKLDADAEDQNFQVEEKLNNLLEQDENLILEEDNPLVNIANLMKTNLLTNLVIDKDELSKKSMHIENLPSHRTLEVGNQNDSVADDKDKAFFIAYLLKHFPNATESKEEHALEYELEYILCGKDSDKGNLEQVLQKILLIRMGINYAYLMTDETKKTEAGVLATVICVLSTTPGMTEAVKQALLLAWAYGESILDLRVLMRKEKVPLVKSENTWQMSLSNLGKLGTDEETEEEKTSERGLNYTEYLTGLLFLENTENLCMRSLDLIDANTSVSVDECMTKAVVESKNVLKAGITDMFQTEFYYK